MKSDWEFGQERFPAVNSDLLLEYVLEYLAGSHASLLAKVLIAGKGENLRRQILSVALVHRKAEIVPSDDPRDLAILITDKNRRKAIRVSFPAEAVAPSDE